MSKGEVITQAKAFEQVVSELRRAGRFAFDTEFVSEHTYEPQLCLVQVATEEQAWAIDPLARGIELEALWELVLDPAMQVVMHAPGEDLKICWFQTGRLPKRVFDVQLAAGLAGYSYPLSLGSLVFQVAGVSVSGGETRTDWRKRPLTPAQIEYALDDVRYLTLVADAIRAKLEGWGRLEWLEPELESQIEDVRARMEDEDRWTRLPGLNQLNRRGLEVARRLVMWREDDARRANRPLRAILKDDLLVAIAKRSPRSQRDLEALRDANRPGIVSRAREIVDRVEEAFAVPDAQLPRLPDRSSEPAGMSMLSSLMSAALSHCCVKSRLSVGVVGTTSDLKDLARWWVEGQPDRWQPALLRGWRAEVCGNALVDLLAGRTSLRIKDPSDEVPVALEPIAGPDGPNSGESR